MPVQVYKSFADKESFWLSSEVSKVVRNVKNCTISSQEGAFQIGVAVKEVRILPV